MSTGFALAAVTAVFRNRLLQHFAAAQLTGPAANVTVSALPPDRITVGSNEVPQLNLFLYQVTPNAAWRNVGLPAADSSGAPMDAPPLALDLHYLLTTYGADMYAGEIILGHALRALHDEPVLGRDVIRNALDPGGHDPALPPELKSAGLADQLELVRFTPAVLTPEEVSKLWAAMQAHYRPSVAYTAGVVLIDSSRARRRALPVAGPAATTTTRPHLPPVLDAVENATLHAPITPASTIVLHGRGFGSQGTVLLGEFEHSLTPAEVTASALTLTLRDVAPKLAAGVIPVQVRMEVPLEDASSGKLTGFTPYPSNSVAFVLVPVITVTAQITGTETVNGQPVASGTIEVAVEPPVTATRRVSLLLNEISPPAGRKAHHTALDAPADNGVPAGAADTTAITFPFQRVPRGSYVVRLSVDGAESPLGQDSSGRYTVPGVNL
ncbi:DUF4255 domain-containing protein [Streptomyces sp. NPDC001657]|uniref:DUF4255 domain-containing protein n=1 Tax=Streptomyces sp. NPDC001657 TaxID=3154522 RepID=UPI00332E823D